MPDADRPPNIDRPDRRPDEPTPGWCYGCLGDLPLSGGVGSRYASSSRSVRGELAPGLEVSTGDFDDAAARQAAGDAAAIDRAAPPRRRRGRVRA